MAGRCGTVLMLCCCARIGDVTPFRSSLTIIVGHKEHVEVGLGLKYARKALGIPGQ